MRIEESIRIDAPSDEVWELITDPEQVPRFLEVTRWELASEQERGVGTRYNMRLPVGSAEVGSLVEVVEWDEPCDMAWTSVTGVDQRGRWRLRERDDGTTKVTLRLSYHAPGGLFAWVADQVSGPMVRGSLKRSLERLKALIEGGDGMSQDEPGMTEKARTVATQGFHTVRTLYGAGLIRAQRPDKTIRALMAIPKWRYTPAAGYAASTVRYPNEPAIVDELGTLTFKTVWERTNRLANALSDAGIKEDDGVAIMCRNHRYFIESIVALSKLGADALLLNTAFAGPQLTDVVKREKPIAIIYDEEFSELLSDAAHRRKRFIAWADDEESHDDPVLEALIREGDPEEPVPPQEEGRVVILTSGTTGTPKGASRSQPGSLTPSAALLSKIPLHVREKALIAAPLFHSWGFAHFTLGLLLSTTVVLQRKFDPERTLAGIAQHRVQSCPMVPVMVQRIMELPEDVRRKYDTSSLRTVPLSGSALSGDLAVKFMDEFGDILYNLYGSTEVAWATIATPDDLRAAPGTAGRPPMGTVVRLYDENGVEVPQGEVGRIFVGNELLFEGYTGGGTKDVIDGLMATGDMGYFDEDGRMHVTGRDDEMIVSGGENVFPAEVEDIISRLDGVNEVAVIGVEDEEFGQRLKAFVVKNDGASVTEDDVKACVKKNLARFKVPREVEFIDELPRNATGKVLKRELEEREKGEGGDGDGKASSDGRGDGSKGAEKSDEKEKASAS